MELDAVIDRGPVMATTPGPTIVSHGDITRMLGVFLATLLIVAMCTALRGAMRLGRPGGPAVQAVRAHRISRQVRRETIDLDRRLEELLRR